MGLSTLVALLLAVMPAPICEGQEAAVNRPHDPALEEYMAQRAQYGFRADEAYVQDLIRRDMWEDELGMSIPVTPEEQEHLRQRANLELGPDAERYLASHPGLAGGISHEGDWPNKPYLLIRLTRDRELHEPKLKALARYPDQLRVIEVDNSEQDLTAIADRIGDDDDELEREGFTLSTVGADTGENAVVVELITRRADAAEFFAERYGPVKVEVVARETHSVVCTRATGYTPSDNGLIIRWDTGGGTQLVRIEVTEHADRVEVAVIERVWNGVVTADLIRAGEEVELAQPLGDRKVIDKATGRRLRIWRDPDTVRAP
jgi:hypothetical protein